MIGRPDTAGPALAPVAASGILRRIGWLAIAWGSLGAAVFLAHGEVRGALALTVAATAVIVGFRGLEGVIRRLQPDPGGGMGQGGGVRFFVRFLLLLTALSIALILGSGHGLALLVGLTALPLAVITEALIQLVSLARRRERGHGGTG